jgi:hypothetical protein
MEPLLAVPEFGAVSDEWLNMEPFQEEAEFVAKSPSFWKGYPTDG